MDNISPDISIVVPVFNRGTVVTATLDSIAAQTERPLALIIVDNNSTDNSLDVVTEWAKLHDSPDFAVTILSEPIPGAAAARNKGFESVTTPYVMFFDSDDLMSPNHVKDFADTFRADPLLDIVGRDIISLELDGSKKRHP
ncbi:MAG: glycosyltransferase family 2 protein, partial [Muribaculum sp.]|nr:glycosyltransferase family 2 protein [Muribaculum sp.]